MATIAVNVLSQGAGVLSSLLAGHEVRVKDATNENAAVGQAVQAYDSAVSALVQSVNTGQDSIATAINWIEQQDSAIESYLESQVGKPGTAWNGSGTCNKACTAGCCVYFNAFKPSTLHIVAALQQVSQSGGSATAKIIPVVGNKYGLQSRQGYSVTFTPSSASPASSITSALDSLTKSFGGGSTGGSSPNLLLFALAGFGVILALMFRK